MNDQPPPDNTNQPEKKSINLVYGRVPTPIPNYTLSTVCPNCDAPTHRRACKVRCDRCGFMWDCSEL